MMGHLSCTYEYLLFLRSGVEDCQVEGSTGYEGDESRKIRDRMENEGPLLSSRRGRQNCTFVIGIVDCIR